MLCDKDFNLTHNDSALFLNWLPDPRSSLNIFIIFKAFAINAQLHANSRVQKPL